MKKYEYILTYGISSETLTINPAGWNNMGVQFIRNEFYHSILRNLTLPLRFARKTGGGADFIIDAYDTEGISAEVTVTINKLNPNTYDYDLFYFGSIDFKTISIERDFVQATLVDGMKLQKLISRDEISIDLFSETSVDDIAIDSFVSSPKQIDLTVIDIILKAIGTCVFKGYFIVANGAELALYPNPVYSWYTFLSNSTPTLNELGERLTLSTEDWTVINKEGYYPYFEQDEENLKIYENTTNETINIICTIQGDLNIKIRDWSVSNGNYTEIIIYSACYDINDVQIGATSIVFQEKITKIGYITYSGDPWPVPHVLPPTITFDSPNIVIDYIVNVSLEETLPPGAYIKFEAYADIGGSETYNTWIYTINYDSSGLINFYIKETSLGKETTTCDIMFPHEAFTRLVQATTSEQDTSKLFHSEFFGRTDSEFETYSSNGTGAFDAIMNGYLIRNYPDAKLNVTLRDLFRSFDALYNLGFGYDRVNDRFYIEPKTAFFDRSYLMFDLGEVADFKRTPMMAAYFSKITGGYENEGVYEEYQGAFEFNAQREYSNSQPVKEEKKIRSKYNLDSLGVEFARRRQYYDYAALDTKYDNLVYIVRTDGTDPVLNEGLTGFDGIENYYNSMFTPRQNAVRWGNVLLSALYKNANPVKFQNSSKQITMSYDGIDELSDIEQSELGGIPLFIPEIYTFKSYINTTILGILNTNPHGFILFTYKGVQYTGFINKIQSGDYNKKTDYELIAVDINLVSLTADNTIITADSTEYSADATIY